MNTSIPAKLAVSDPWYHMILELLERNDIDVNGHGVLEVGCGLGGFCLKITGKGASVIGVDYSVSALRAAARLGSSSESGSPAARFVAADATRLPFQDNAFQLVICAETLEHTFAVGVCLAELRRVCAGGGLVAISVPNALMAFPFGLVAHAIGADQPQVLLNYFRLRQLAQEAGFHLVDEGGTNFFRDMILNDALSPVWRRRAQRLGRLLDDRIDRGTHLWKITAGTLGMLLTKPSRESVPVAKR